MREAKDPCLQHVIAAMEMRLERSRDLISLDVMVGWQAAMDFVASLGPPQDKPPEDVPLPGESGAS